MSPDTLAGDVVTRDPPLLHADEPVRSAVRRVLESGLPALPVVDASERFVGIFGEREFVAAVFPGYLSELRSARFVPQAIDRQLERRSGCAREPVARYANTEHIDVGPNPSDAELAEIFLHHRVLIVPLVDGGRVVGLVSRSEFFRGLVGRFEDIG
jgi:CBS domain-containing protein